MGLPRPVSDTARRGEDSRLLRRLLVDVNGSFEGELLRAPDVGGGGDGVEAAID